MPEFVFIMIHGRQMQSLKSKYVASKVTLSKEHKVCSMANCNNISDALQD